MAARLLNVPSASDAKQQQQGQLATERKLKNGSYGELRKTQETLQKAGSDRNKARFSHLELNCGYTVM